MPVVVKCPVCRVEISWEGNPFRPFCSERCRLVDLGSWVEGKYRIPGEELKDESENENGKEEEPS